jgi:hypothetical protein
MQEPTLAAVYDALQEVLHRLDIIEQKMSKTKRTWIDEVMEHYSTLYQYASIDDNKLSMTSGDSADITITYDPIMKMYIIDGWRLVCCPVRDITQKYDKVMVTLLTDVFRLI